MSEEENIQKIEAQKQVERKSSNSNVKTPLVDTLRRYFGQGISEELIEQQRNYTATSWSPV